MERVGVIGLGKLGLPIAAVIAEAGYTVLAIDQKKSLIDKLNNQDFDYDEPGLNEILINNINKIKFGLDYGLLTNVDIVYLILPTPSDLLGYFDESIVIAAIENLIRIWGDRKSNKVIVVVSTLMPQTCEKKIQPLLNTSENHFKIKLLYSPEFIALGSVIHNLKNPDMVLIGAESSDDSELHLKIQKSIIGEFKYKILNLTEAEIVKLLVNCYVTMKISFANFVGEIGDSLTSRVDVREISNALGMDSRIGEKYIRPGLGFGGPCFPRDNTALISWSKKLGIKADLAEATVNINNRQPSYMAERIYSAFKQYKKIGILGYTYKVNSSVTEESQRISLANLLLKKGFDVSAYDPFVNNPEGFTNPEKVYSDINGLFDCDVIITSKEYEKYFDPNFQGKYFYI